MRLMTPVYLLPAGTAANEHLQGALKMKDSSAGDSSEGHSPREPGSALSPSPTLRINNRKNPGEGEDGAAGHTG